MMQQSSEDVYPSISISFNSISLVSSSEVTSYSDSVSSSEEIFPSEVFSFSANFSF